MDIIRPVPICGEGCLGACYSLCVVPPLYLISVTDHVTWNMVEANPY